MHNYSILDLFHQETKNHTVTIAAALTSLKNQPSSMDELERLTQAIHSIWGSAKLVGREAAAHLAQVMKDCTIAAQDRTAILTEDRIEVLFHASKLLLEMSKPVEATFTDWMSEHTWEVATVQKSLAIILTAESIVSPQIQEYTPPPETRLSVEILPEIVTNIESREIVNEIEIDLPLDLPKIYLSTPAFNDSIDREPTLELEHLPTIQVSVQGRYEN